MGNRCPHLETTGGYGSGDGKITELQAGAAGEPVLNTLSPQVATGDSRLTFVCGAARKHISTRVNDALATEYCGSSEGVVCPFRQAGWKTAE